MNLIQLSKPPSRETIIEKLIKFFPQNEYRIHGRRIQSSGHSSSENITKPLKTKSLPNIQSPGGERRFIFFIFFNLKDKKEKQ